MVSCNGNSDSRCEVLQLASYLQNNTRQRARQLAAGTAAPRPCLPRPCPSCVTARCTGFITVRCAVQACASESLHRRPAEAGIPDGGSVDSDSRGRHAGGAMPAQLEYRLERPAVHRPLQRHLEVGGLTVVRWGGRGGICMSGDEQQCSAAYGSCSAHGQPMKACRKSVGLMVHVRCVWIKLEQNSTLFMLLSESCGVGLVAHAGT